MPDQQFEIIHSADFTQGLIAITDYLKDQAGLDVVDRLTSQVDEQISALSDFPYLYASYEYCYPYRKLVVARFPFVVFYFVDEGTQQVNIHRIYHTSQNYQVEINQLI